MPYIGRGSDFGVRSVFHFLASNGDTSVSGADADGKNLNFTDGNFIDVYLNGVRLKSGEDYNTSTANTVAGLSALNANDEVNIVVYDTFTVADTVKASEGGTFSGAVTLSGGVTGDVTATGTVNVTGDTSAGDDASMGFTSAEGLILTGQGSTNDVTIKNDADTAVISIPTGGTGVTFAGAVTANSGVVVDDITIDGTEIDLSSGDLTIDVAGDIKLDADGAEIFFADGGTDFLKIQNDSGTAQFRSLVSDGDIQFVVNDGGSNIVAMTIDSSSAGQALFRDGTAALPAISFIDDVDTGLATLADNTMSVTLEGTERVRFIQTYGETVFGADTGSTTGGGKITVYSNSSGRATFNGQHDRTGADTNGYPYGIISNFTNLGDSTSFHLFEGYGGGAIRFRVNSNGNVINVNNSYGSISDVNLKENIEDASSQWDDIKAVKVRKFSWKSDKKDKADMLGVIAQELETAGMGGLVQESPDTRPTEDGGFEQTGTSHKSVKYSILYMKAIKALQETMTKVEKLETVAKSKGWDLS